MSRWITRIGFLLLGVTLGATAMLVHLDHVRDSPLTIEPCPNPHTHPRHK